MAETLTNGAPAPSTSERSRSPTIAVYSLILITLLYCFAFVDRQILNLLVGSIKKDFGATDLQVGYLIGPAFIFAYIAVGLPAGFIVDRFSRRNLIIGAGCLWSAATCAAAFVHSYTALAATRAIIGGSEAVLFPAGMSLIADMFDRRRLPIANSVFLMSPYIGGGLALIGGGFLLGSVSGAGTVDLPLIGRVHGWQTIFLYVGVIGFLPVLLLPTIPHFRPSGATPSVPRARFGMLEGVRYMLSRRRFYLFFYLGMSTANLVAQMVAAWAPTYLTRAFHMTPIEVGASYGPSVLVAGVAGSIAGPLVNAFLARRSPDSTMRTACLGPVFILIIFTLLHVVSSRAATMTCLALLTFSYSFPLSVAGTAMQVVTPPALRGLAASVYLVSNGIIGYALGPTLVPLFTAHVLHDPAQIGPAMGVIGACCGIVSLGFLLLATRGYRLEREAAAASERGA